MKYISLTLLLLTSHLPLYLMDETRLLINNTSPTQPTSCRTYLKYAATGAAFGLGCALWFITIFSGECLGNSSCGHTVFGTGSKTPEDEFKSKYMVEIIAGASIGICTLGGSLIGASVAKFCPCKRQGAQ